MGFLLSWGQKQANKKTILFTFTEFLPEASLARHKTLCVCRSGTERGHGNSERSDQTIIPRSPR